MWHINQPQKCKECGSTERMTIDRIQPEKFGGKYEIKNIQLLCYRCNCCKKISNYSVKESLRPQTHKTCNECNKVLPLNEIFWHKTGFTPKYRNNGLSEWHPKCKECRLFLEAQRWSKTHSPTRKVKHQLAYVKNRNDVK
jgi:hypothetical protein